MIGVYPAGQSRSFSVEFVDSDGNPVTPASASYVLLDDSESEVIPQTLLDVSSAPSFVDILIDAPFNALSGSNRAFRQLIVSFQDSQGSSFVVEVPYLLESIGSVVAGENSFASYGSLVLESLNLANMEAFNEATISDQRAALINAWHNISNVSITGIDNITRTNQITSDVLNTLSSRVLQKLKQSQLIEANFILGGNPVEDRRRTGMISDSSGESAQFFRTSKPIELPICKEAANALRGLINWNMKLAR